MSRIESLVSELATFAGEPAAAPRGGGVPTAAPRGGGVSAAEAEDAKPRFLSLYLWTDPSRGPGANVRAQLLQLVRPIRERVTGRDEARQLDEAVSAVGEYLRKMGSPPRGLAVFCSPERDRFDAVRLRVPLSPHAEWSPVPYLRPLLAALDEHERTLIVLADKERARFILDWVQHGEELATLTDDIPGRHAAGGYSQNKYQRDHDKHVLWHAKRIVESLARLTRTMPLDRVLLGGPPEILAEVRHLLPARLRRMIAGEIGASIEAPLPDVLDVARRRGEELERDGELELVRSLVEQLGRGRALGGVDAVVEEANRGAVALLVYEANFAEEAGGCDGCGAVLRPPAPAACPYCGATVARHDLVDLLAARVLADGGRVEEVRGDAAGELHARGGVAVLLRYRGEPARAGVGSAPTRHRSERGGSHAGT